MAQLSMASYSPLAAFYSIRGIFFVIFAFSGFLPNMLVLLEWISEAITSQPTNRAASWL